MCIYILCSEFASYNLSLQIVMVSIGMHADNDFVPVQQIPRIITANPKMVGFFK